MCHCVSNDHEKVKESHIDDDSGKGNDVAHQKQKQEKNPVQRFPLQSNKICVKQRSANHVFRFQSGPNQIIISGSKNMVKLNIYLEII
jgi:hypothetical protein